MLREAGSAGGTQDMSSYGTDRPFRYSVPIGSVAGVTTTWKSGAPPGTRTSVTRLARSWLNSSNDETVTDGCESVWSGGSTFGGRLNPNHHTPTAAAAKTTTTRTIFTA
jgi:hypothetical protein